MPKGLLAKLLLLIAIGASLGAIAQIMLSPVKTPPPMLHPSGWSLLTDDEQKILQPLAGKWEGMGSTQQEKWRAVARKYPSLSPRAQQKIQRRMTRWAGATPEQRALARKKFKAYKKKQPEEQERVRSAWHGHQATKDKPVSLPGSDKPPATKEAGAKESENASSVPTIEGLGIENRK
jgi:hypothetical protein